MNAKKIEAIRAALQAGLQIVLTTRDMSELMSQLGIEGEWRNVENHLPCTLLYHSGLFWLDGASKFAPFGVIGREHMADLQNSGHCASAASAGPTSGLPCEPQRLVDSSNPTQD